MASLTQLQEVPPESIILLVGSPGSGKSAFCEQTVLQSLAIERPIIYLTTECGPSKTEARLKDRGLSEVQKGLLNFIDAYNETVGVSVSERPDTVYADCNDLSSIDIAVSKLQERIGRKGILFVFDSLTSPYLFSGAEILRFMRQTLSRFAASGNAVLACIDEGCGKSEDLVAMMSLSNGVIKMETAEGKQFLNVVKHPKLKTIRIEALLEPEPIRLEECVFNPDVLARYIRRMREMRDEAVFRREVGDFVNLFWPNLAHWSCMLWDPKRFPMMVYEMNKEDAPGMFKIMRENEAIKRVMFPWPKSLLLRFMPKSFSKVKDIKKMAKNFFQQSKQERSGIMEYLEDASKTDEHYARMYESSECWGFENVGAPMASYLPAMIAGFCKAFESLKGLERDWNAIETKCIGLGDPYCEIKLAPGEIDGLKDSLEKDSSVLEKIHDRLMQRLMGFLLDEKPLVERPKLGSDIHVHPAFHTMGSENIPFMSRIWSERYKMALRIGGAKAGKEVGEHLIEGGMRDDEAVKRILHFLEYCKVGKVTIGETIRIKENCESSRTKWFMMKEKVPSCYFTTGFLNGFFSAVKNQHVRETKCIAMGDHYCEWEFR